MVVPGPVRPFQVQRGKCVHAAEQNVEFFVWVVKQAGEVATPAVVVICYSRPPSVAPGQGVRRERLPEWHQQPTDSGFPRWLQRQPQQLGEGQG